MVQPGPLSERTGLAGSVYESCDWHCLPPHPHPPPLTLTRWFMYSAPLLRGYAPTCQLEVSGECGPFSTHAGSTCWVTHTCISINTAGKCVVSRRSLINNRCAQVLTDTHTNSHPYHFQPNLNKQNGNQTEDTPFGKQHRDRSLCPIFFHPRISHRNFNEAELIGCPNMKSN